MRPEQQRLYFALWRDACRNQGWTTANGWTTKAIDAKRKEVHTEVFESPISSKEINSREDFGAIKAKFLELADNLAGTIETDHPEFDHARRLRACIADLLKCLRVYLSDQAEPYLRSILVDKFGISDVDSLSAERPKPFLRRGILIEPPSQLEQALMTLSGRVNGKSGFRHLAGHSMHDMRTRAGLPCNCLQCVPRRGPVLVLASNEPF